MITPLAHTAGWALVFAAMAVGYWYDRRWGQRQGGGMGDDESKFKQLDLLDALAEKDRVLAELEASNAGWTTLALIGFDLIPDGTEGIFEDFRKLILDNGAPAPRHQNGWGAFCSGLVKRKQLVPTGERRPMRGILANGRKSDVYRKCTTPSQN